MLLSDQGFAELLRGAVGWTWWSLWVPSNEGLSVIVFIASQSPVCSLCFVGIVGYYL